MTKITNKILLAAAVALTAGFAAAPASAQSIRLAFGDLPGIESIAMLTAIERAREAGASIEVIALNDEDLAAQAIVGGQADVAIGTPYALIQEAGVPVRMFAKISNARFFPVVNTEFYDSWEDLDGQEIAVQARGSGTEAIMVMMAEAKGISYSAISYVPGSEVRRGALMQGTIRASIVDAANRSILLAEAPDRFMVLPIEDVSATDEALFARSDYLANNAAAVDVLVEALITVAREIDANPQAAVDFLHQYGLLADLNPSDAEVLDYYTETTEADALITNGGTVDEVISDFGFFGASGQLTGDPATLNPADFWDFSSVERVLGKLGAM